GLALEPFHLDGAGHGADLHRARLLDADAATRPSDPAPTVTALHLDGARDPTHVEALDLLDRHRRAHGRDSHVPEPPLQPHIARGRAHDDVGADGTADLDLVRSTGGRHVDAP